MNWGGVLGLGKSNHPVTSGSIRWYQFSLPLLSQESGWQCKIKEVH